MSREVWRTFLQFWDKEISEAELDLWEAATLRVKDNIPEAMARWLEYSKTKPKPHDLVSLADKPAKGQSMKNILNAVSLEFDIPASHLIGRSRVPTVSKARQDFMSRAWAAGYSTTQIGKFLGGRDHSTIVSGIQNHRNKK